MPLQSIGHAIQAIRGPQTETPRTTVQFTAVDALIRPSRNRHTTTLLTEDALRLHVVGMSRDYSVSELAAAVAPVSSFPAAPTEADVDLVTRRLRSWTLAGALMPVGDPHSGTGKARRYDQFSVYPAAVLNALAENDQSIGVLIEVGRLIRNLVGPQPLVAGTTLDRWKQAVSGDAEVFLVMGAGAKVQGTRPTIEGLLIRKELEKIRLMSGVFVNLTAVFARVLR